MAELGVGVRVWVGWTADVEAGHERALCRTGTITEGPFVPGPVLLKNGALCWNPQTQWNIAMDEGHRCAASESILFPIDDGDDTRERERDRELADA